MSKAEWGSYAGNPRLKIHTGTHYYASPVRREIAEGYLVDAFLDLRYGSFFLVRLDRDKCVTEVITWEPPEELKAQRMELVLNKAAVSLDEDE